MNSAGQCGTDARDGSEFCFRGVFNALSSAEMAQERLQFLRAKTFDGFQRVGETRATSALAVEGVHEPMGFVTGVNEHPSAAVKHQRLVFCSEDGLLSLGKGGKREAVFPSVFFQRLADGAEMSFSAVDE